MLKSNPHPGATVPVTGGQMPEIFRRTSGEVAREARVSQPTVRLYAKLGLIPHITASDGTRLFSAEAADRVREIYAQRVARRVHNVQPIGDIDA